MARIAARSTRSTSRRLFSYRIVNSVVLLALRAAGQGLACAQSWLSSLQQIPSQEVETYQSVDEVETLEALDTLDAIQDSLEALQASGADIVGSYFTLDALHQAAVPGCGHLLNQLSTLFQSARKDRVILEFCL